MAKKRRRRGKSRDTRHCCESCGRETSYYPNCYRCDCQDDGTVDSAVCPTEFYYYGWFAITGLPWEDPIEDEDDIDVADVDYVDVESDIRYHGRSFQPNNGYEKVR